MLAERFRTFCWPQPSCLRHRDAQGAGGDSEAGFASTQILSEPCVCPNEAVRVQGTRFSTLQKTPEKSLLD